MEWTDRIIKRRKPFFCVVFFFICLLSYSQLTIASWNIRHFGKSKSDETIENMAKIIQKFDVLAVQEVVVAPEGAKAVSRLVAVLNNKNNQWDYVISNPTTGNSSKSERYAFLWKKKKIKIIQKARLATEFESKMEREPFLFFFEYQKKKYTIVNFHAPSKKDQPETELKYFKSFSEYYKGSLLFLGDFNTVNTHSVFNPIKKMGYVPLLENQKTTLRQKCINNDCLASAYDHMFYKSSEFTVLSKGVIHFYKDFKDLKEAQKISDHIPIYIQIK